MEILTAFSLLYISGNLLAFIAGALDGNCDGRLRLKLGKIIFPGYLIGFYMVKLFSLPIGKE